MGAAASVAELEKNVQKNPTYNGPVNFNCTDTLAVFATEMIARSPKVEGLNLLLESENGRDAFTQFLRNEYVLDSFLVQHSDTPLSNVEEMLSSLHIRVRLLTFSLSSLLIC